MIRRSALRDATAYCRCGEGCRPEQAYVACEVVGPAGTSVPNLPVHAEAALPWLDMPDGWSRSEGRARAPLQAKAAP